MYELMSSPLRGTSEAPLPCAIARPLLLVVDDEPQVLKVVERLAAGAGFEVVTCASGAEAMPTLMRRRADLAMVDLRMPDVNGLDVLRQIRTAHPGCEVILMTAHAEVDSAVDAIKMGAREYLTKPFDFDRLRQVLVEIRLELERRVQVVALESQVARQLEFCGMLGRSPVMQDVFSLIQRLAPHARVVLLSGESGSSPISSRNSVPPCAASKAPPFDSTAPVNAPRTWPNSSLSNRLSTTAAQLIVTKGLFRRVPT